jgi:hypothetical protein
MPPASNELVTKAALDALVTAGQWVLSGRGFGFLYTSNQIVRWDHFKSGIINRVTDGEGGDSYSSTQNPNYSQLDTEAAIPPAGAPSSLGSTDNSFCEVDGVTPNYEPPSLSWICADGFSRTYIERDTGSGYVQIAFVAPTVATYVDTDDSPGTGSWTYRVRHKNEGVPSSYSNTTTVVFSNPCGA